MSDKKLGKLPNVRGGFYHVHSGDDLALAKAGRIA